MSTYRDRDLAHLLPLNQRALLTRAIGLQLLEIERLLWTGSEDHRARGGDPRLYFARASGPTQLGFSSGISHQLAVWPSALSVIVDGRPLASDPDAHWVALSRCPCEQREDWLFGCLGCRIIDVRVHLYQGPEVASTPPQAAISYCLDSGVELFYAIYIHGQMDGDQLLRTDAIRWDSVSHSVSLGDAPSSTSP